MLSEYSQLLGCAKTEKATSSARLCLLASLGLGIVGLPRHRAVNPRGAGLGLPPRAPAAPSGPSPGPGRGRAPRACRELRRGPGPVWRPRERPGRGCPGEARRRLEPGQGIPRPRDRPREAAQVGPETQSWLWGGEQGEVTGPSSVPASPLGGGRGVCNARGCLSRSRWVWESRARSGAGLGSSAEVLDVSKMRLLSSRGICWCFT